MLTPRFSDEWDGATCAQLGGSVADELFFPLGPDRHELAAQAVNMCAQCPLRTHCINTSLEYERGTGLDNRHGIRGGLTPEQRLALDRENQKETVPA